MNSDIEKRFEEKAKIYEVAETFEWRKWCFETPSLKFPSHWFVQIIPPFGGAIARFRVSLTQDMKNAISIYLDCYSMLGYFGLYDHRDEIHTPYWEIYPYDGDTFRCAMAETDKLLAAIEEALQDKYGKELEA